MRVLGVDIACLSGWAVVEDLDGVLALRDYGVIDIKGKEGPARFRNARDAYRELLEAHDPDLVCYELVNFGKFRLAYKSFCSLRAIFLLCCAEKGVPLCEVDTSGLKEYWAGRGGASKADMCRATREHTGVGVYSEEEVGKKAYRKGDEDRADAIAIAFWGAEPWDS